MWKQTDFRPYAAYSLFTPVTSREISRGKVRLVVRERANRAHDCKSVKPAAAGENVRLLAVKITPAAARTRAPKICVTTTTHPPTPPTISRRTRSFGTAGCLPTSHSTAVVAKLPLGECNAGSGSTPLPPCRAVVTTASPDSTGVLRLPRNGWDEHEDQRRSLMNSAGSTKPLSWSCMKKMGSMCSSCQPWPFWRECPEGRSEASSLQRVTFLGRGNGKAENGETITISGLEVTVPGCGHQALHLGSRTGHRTTLARTVEPNERSLMCITTWPILTPDVTAMRLGHAVMLPSKIDLERSPGY
ncbi:uncharacterized protein B0I36DRAFT_403145 [Microdochium trichocladiopsis]|uniref:Uncharacterized protein n=1 Tax=Microdochium trichocladiopsis TaxID=1682393 RepID=A0A9P8YE88_9PEZI|nr:uncharacterized protein B0I36DRAFT_403145 [Microdochium trichocladiopsis]KAH7037624.1 hypothetical protein B0I36DRAFT_403145 [Microdochium trichocladiopsis]